jgi:hypothetical protein
LRSGTKRGRPTRIRGEELLRIKRENRGADQGPPFPIAGPLFTVRSARRLSDNTRTQPRPGLGRAALGPARPVRTRGRDFRSTTIRLPLASRASESLAMPLHRPSSIV